MSYLPKIICLLLFTLTTYQNHVYRTQCSVDVNAPASSSDIVIDQLVYDFQYDFEHLFKWAFLNLGKQNDDDRDALLLSSKSITYIPEEEYGKIVLDVIIPHLTTFRDVTVEGIIADHKQQSDYAPDCVSDGLTMEKIPTWTRHMYIEAHKTGIVFKKAYGNIYVIPVSETKSVWYIDINFHFSWLLRTFMTRRIYRNTIQWRVEQYLNNLKTAAENPETME